MGWGWGESEDAHQQVYDQGGGYDNQAKFSHELIAGAASFEGFKLFEDHQRKEGMNAYDRERAHHHAKEASRDMYDEHYIDNQGADQYDPNQYNAPERFQGQGNSGGYQNRDQGNY
ncbi:hypothetical protein MMC22_004668 [Lobaria immixta]|nr:hypothetical protein [Lobaria immixta]